jgi:hypothetical protein
MNREPKPTEQQRQPKYARVHESLVDTLCLVIALSLLPALLLESLSLVERIVQLGVGVTDLLGSNECLETFTDTGSRSVVLGERRHDLRVTNYCRTGHLVIVLSRRKPSRLTDEGRVDALVLNVLADKLETRMESAGNSWIESPNKHTLSSSRALVLGSEHSTPFCRRRHKSDYTQGPILQ